MALTPEQLAIEIARKKKTGEPRNFGKVATPAPGADQTIKPATKPAPVTPVQTPTQYAATDPRQKLADSLAQYGLDPKNYGPNVSAQQLYKNMDRSVVGKPTLDAQKALFESIMTTAGKYGAMPKGTGNEIDVLPAFTGMSEWIRGLEGQKYQGTIEHDDAMANDKAQRDIQWANYGLSKAAGARAAAAVAKGNKDDADKKVASQNTMQWIADMASVSSTKDEAIQFIVDHSPEIAADNVNTDDLRAWVSEMFESKGGTTASGGEKLTPAQIISNARILSQQEIDGIIAENEATGGGIVDILSGKSTTQKPVPDSWENLQKWIKILTEQNSATVPVQ